MFVLILTVLMAMALLAGCGQAGGGSDDGDGAGGSPAGYAAGTEAIDDLETIGDAMNVASAEVYQAATYEDVHIYVFEYEGTIYRVFAPVTEEIFQAIMDIDYDDPDKDEKENALVSPLVIEKRENISEKIPSQEELDEWKGKTGEDLLNDEWEIYGYNLDTMEFYMNHQLFSYIVTFDGELELTDDFDEYEAVKPLKILSVTYEGLGDAASKEW